MLVGILDIDKVQQEFVGGPGDLQVGHDGLLQFGHRLTVIDHYWKLFLLVTNDTEYCGHLAGVVEAKVRWIGVHPTLKSASARLNKLRTRSVVRSSPPWGFH